MSQDSKATEDDDPTRAATYMRGLRNGLSAAASEIRLHAGGLTAQDWFRPCARMVGIIAMSCGVESLLPFAPWWCNVMVCCVVIALVSWGWTGRWFA